MLLRREWRQRLEIWLHYNSASSNTVAYPKRIMEGHKSMWRVDGTGEWMGICRQVLVSYLLNVIHTRSTCTETNKMTPPLYASVIPGMTGGNVLTSTHIYNQGLNCFFVQFHLWGSRQRTAWSSNIATLSHFGTNLLLTLWRKNFLENLTVAKLLKEFPAFYDTEWFITMLTRSSKPVPVLSHTNPIHILHFYKFNTQLNISFPFTATSHKNLFFWGFDISLFLTSLIFTTLPPHEPSSMLSL